MKHKILLLALSVLLPFQQALALDWFELHERRRDQSPRDTDYAAIPYAMQMPGIGSWVGLAANGSNIMGSPTDWYIASMYGDLNGAVMVITDIPLGWEPLSLNIFSSRFSKAGVETYDRGISSDYTQSRLFMADQVDYTTAMLNLTFLERRLQYYASKGRGTVHLSYLVDEFGNVLTDVSNYPPASFDTQEMGLIFDNTDDRNDPHHGHRFEVRRVNAPRNTPIDPSYYKVDFAYTYYLPVGEHDAWAFSAYSSDAFVISQGSTDPAVVRAANGLDCPNLTGVAYTTCLQLTQPDVDQIIAKNTYGDASSLGGTQFLRGYPQGRFYAAHVLFLGTEYRWNFDQTSEPYDFFLAKGIQTQKQVAFFAESGSAADIWHEVGQQWKSNVGVGFRLLLSSGMVLRLDLAVSQEESQVTMFFNYPWGVFY